MEKRSKQKWQFIQYLIMYLIGFGLILTLYVFDPVFVEILSGSRIVILIVGFLFAVVGGVGLVKNRKIWH